LTLDTVRDSIARGLRTLEQRRQNHQIQTNALALANRRVASTTLFVQAGLNPVRDLLEAQDAQIAAQNAVTAAIIDHQEARLQLMLDLGALDASESKFWLKDHLADFLPVESPSRALSAGAERPVVPPDQFFNQ
jgi:outer membrane protein TolC